MRAALGVLSSMLMLECGVPDARGAPVEEETAAPRFVLARMFVPSASGGAPEPPLLRRADCSDERRRDCIRFCVREYSPAASRRCIRACSQYCRTCTADRRRYCIGN